MVWLLAGLPVVASTRATTMPSILGLGGGWAIGTSVGVGVGAEVGVSLGIASNVASTRAITVVSMSRVGILVAVGSETSSSRTTVREIPGLGDGTAAVHPAMPTAVRNAPTLLHIHFRGRLYQGVMITARRCAYITLLIESSWEAEQCSF